MSDMTIPDAGEAEIIYDMAERLYGQGLFDEATAIVQLHAAQFAQFDILRFVGSAMAIAKQLTSR